MNIAGTVKREQLIGRLTDELFAHDQGFSADLIENEEEREEYTAVREYVEDTILPIIESVLA